MAKNKNPRGLKTGGRKRKQKTNTKRVDASGYDKKANKMTLKKSGRKVAGLIN